MAELPRSLGERRAESFVERRANAGSREKRSFRLAGELFNTEAREKERELIKQAKDRLQRKRPVGVGFGTNDNYGPDESWESQDPIKYTPFPDYYKSYKSF